MTRNDFTAAALITLSLGNLAMAPAAHAGVTFEKADGTVIDVTSDFAAGTATAPSHYTVPSNGTLTIGAGTWYTTVSMGSKTVDIQGAGAGSTVLSSGGVRQVMTVRGGAVSVSDLTLADGAGYRGGCLNLFGTDATVTDVDIADCTARGDGAGIAMRDGASLVMSGGEIRDNDAAVAGGGIAILDMDSVADFQGTVFSGNQATDGGAMHVFEGTATATGVHMDGNMAADMGGAVHVDMGDVRVYDSIVENGSADRGGAGAVSMGSSMTGILRFDGSAVRYNSADLGGGLYATYGGTTGITGADGDLHDNTARRGGGMYADSGTLRISDAAVRDNTATEQGGGIFSKTVQGWRDGTGFIKMMGGRISGNTANLGGGIALYDTGMLLWDGELSDNTAATQGGGAFLDDSSLQLSRSTVSGNQAAHGGGGVQAIASEMDGWGTTFEGNRASTGGAFRLADSEAVFENVTIRGNTAGGSGGGAAVVRGSVLDVQGTIEDNTAGRQGGALYIDIGGAFASVHDSTMQRNVGRWGGAAFLSRGGALDIADSVVSANRAKGVQMSSSAGTFSTVGTEYANNPSGGVDRDLRGSDGVVRDLDVWSDMVCDASGCVDR